MSAHRKGSWGNAFMEYGRLNRLLPARVEFLPVVRYVQLFWTLSELWQEGREGLSQRNSIDQLGKSNQPLNMIEIAPQRGVAHY